MRTIFKPVLLVMLVSGCGSEPEAVVEQNDHSLTETEYEIPTTNPDEELMSADSAFEQNVKAFPKHWVEVGVKGKELTYTEYCGMGHPHWKLIETDSSWQIETFYGQDGERWNVINMTANTQSAEGQVFQEGIFVVTKITYPDNELYEVSYFWNQTVGFCTFGDFFDKTKKFGDNEQFKSFRYVKEECDL